MAEKSFHFLIIILILTIRHEYSMSQVKKLDCESKMDCFECITTRGCSWCSQVKHEVVFPTSKKTACYEESEISNFCERDSMENPKSSVRVIANKHMKNSENGDTVQVRPQELFIRLKPGEEIAVDIEFKKAENYPVDLYYLMDLSSSMAKFKNNLSKLGNKLAETMKNLTSDFQLGFGSFVDKVVLPFTSTLPRHLKQPCPKCRSPYSFKNHMSLSKETNRFSEEVHKAELSGNIDTPEGVFDGLMQAMVCQKELNWREKARHIIVVSTDAPFHLAGDGKLGGIIEPHDGLCHLDENGDYTHSLMLDYPSVSHINEKALENSMNIIFAVVNKVKFEYHSLAQEIRGASLGLLDAGENIADLIKAQYEKISTTIRLIQNSDGLVKVRFSSKCAEEWKNTNECLEVKEGSTVYFKAHLSLPHCPQKKFSKQDIVIKPEGINETLTIHVEHICDCQCSSLNHSKTEINSEYCSFSGDLICGQCVCHEGQIGERCECSGSDKRILNVTETSGCISNKETKELCSGRGHCRCGVCQCHKRENRKEEITGKFCECDNYSCQRVNGVLCSGQGSCKCGKCLCEPGWSGLLCDCPTDEDNCRDVGQTEVCSGKGRCVCGKCFCNNETQADGNRYSGKYCQNCMTCTEACDSYNDCVECLAYKTGPLASTNCNKCTDKFLLTTVENFEAFIKNATVKTCMSADEKGCTFRYTYKATEEDRILIWSEKVSWCPKEINVIAVVAGTTGGTIFLGLLSLIIWKVVVNFHDKREFEKFERERSLAKWGKGENPLFKTATRTYENPTYHLRSHQVSDQSCIQNDEFDEE